MKLNTCIPVLRYIYVTIIIRGNETMKLRKGEGKMAGAGRKALGGRKGKVANDINTF